VTARRIALAALGGALIAAAAGAGAYLLVSRPFTGPATATPGPATATPSPATPLPLPAISAPPSSGELPIEPATDCGGGSPADAYAAAAAADVCRVLTPLAAMDPVCATPAGPSCESAARDLALAAEASLADIRGRHPVTAGEKAADPELRAAFGDYATAGADVAVGIAEGDHALAVRGVDALTPATEALSAAAVDLGGS
jgi:hypothetical protein